MGDKPLRGKVAWITGAGRGIGQALALALARAGAFVAGCALEPEELEETERLVRKAAPAAEKGPFFAAADVTLSEQLESFAERAETEVGPPYILVANAGATDIHHRPIAELPEEVWRRIIGVNLTGTFLTLKTCLPYLRARGGAHVVLVSSLLGQPGRGIPGDAPYCASKAGLEALKAVAALEWAGLGISVNSVYPARKVDTGFFAHLPEAERKKLAPPDILNDVVIALASAPPGTLTGEAVDGARWLADPGYREQLLGRIGTGDG